MMRPFELLMRIIDAAREGRGLDAEATASLKIAIDRLVMGKTVDEAFGLSPGWRCHFRTKIRDRVVSGWGESENIAARARKLHRELSLYLASGRFDRDLTSGGKPVGERGDLYTLTIAYGGRIPSLRTLQRHLSM